MGIDLVEPLLRRIDHRAQRRRLLVAGLEALRDQLLETGQRLGHALRRRIDAGLLGGDVAHRLLVDDVGRLGLLDLDQLRVDCLQTADHLLARRAEAVGRLLDIALELAGRGLLGRHALGDRAERCVRRLGRGLQPAQIVAQRAQTGIDLLELAIEGLHPRLRVARCCRGGIELFKARLDRAVLVGVPAAAEHDRGAAQQPADQPRQEAAAPRRLHDRRRPLRLDRRHGVRGSRLAVLVLAHHVVPCAVGDLMGGLARDWCPGGGASRDDLLVVDGLVAGRHAGRFGSGLARAAAANSGPRRHALSAAVVAPAARHFPGLPSIAFDHRPTAVSRNGSAGAAGR